MTRKWAWILTSRNEHRSTVTCNPSKSVTEKHKIHKIIKLSALSLSLSLSLSTNFLIGTEKNHLQSVLQKRKGYWCWGSWYYDYQARENKFIPCLEKSKIAIFRPIFLKTCFWKKHWHILYVAKLSWNTVSVATSCFAHICITQSSGKLIKILAPASPWL